MATKVTENNDAKIKPKKDKARAVAVARPAPRDNVVTRVTHYLREVQTELKKTNWPSKAELIASTQVVIGLLVVVGVYVFLVDTILTFLFNAAGLGMGK